MTDNIFKNEKAGFFAMGILAATAGVKLIKSKAFRSCCVKTIASGMKLREDAVSTFTKMKEEAADICYDAKMSNCSDESCGCCEE